VGLEAWWCGVNGRDWAEVSVMSLIADNLKRINRIS
jgi:hypothetical protein